MDSSQTQRAIELHQQKYKAYEIADILNAELGGGTITELEVKRAWRGLSPEQTRPEVSVAVLDTPETGVDSIRQWLGDSWSPNRLPLRDVNSVRRICAVGDLHGAPSKAIVKAIIAQEPTHIIIGGDLLHSEQATKHAASKFRHGRKTLKEEIACVRAALELWLSETDAHIKIMLGNHDRWTMRMIAELVPDFILDFYTDPIQILVAGLPPERVELIDTRLDFNFPNGETELFGDSQFLYPFGDAIFSHMNFTSKIPGRAVENFSKWIDEHHQQLGLPEFTLFCQFHGHKISCHNPRSGWRVLVEPGMGGMMDTENYKADYEAKWNFGAQGFVYFKQYQDDARDWRTDRSSVKIIQPNL